MVGGTLRTKLVVATGTACFALLVVFTSLSAEEIKPSYLPKEGEVVAILSRHNGRFLEVSPHDGRLRATAQPLTKKDALPPKTALFRVMLLTTPMVHMLIDSMRTANSAEWSKRRHWTGMPPAHNSSGDPGCQCSGYSNDHGFGAYCYGWEYEGQMPW